MSLKFTFPYLTIILLFTLAFGQIPQKLSYQGILTDATGTVVPDGDYDLTFNLYEVESGGSTIWTETQSVSIIDGLFNVILGELTALNVPFDQTYWLGITVATGTELIPRIQLTSSAYSFTSRNSEFALSVADTCITTEKIADGAVTQKKLAPDVSLPPGGTAGGDLTGTYPDPTIAPNAVNSAKIQDGTIQTADLAYTPVTRPLTPGVATGEIANDAVTTVKIADGAITQDKLSPGLSIPPGGTAGGDLTGTFPNPTIAPNAVNSTKIQDLQVASADLANNAVITSKINDGAVTQAKLAAGVSLPPGGSAGGDLTGIYPNPTIASNAVNSAKIQDLQVASADLANNAVITSKINDGAVTQAKLAPGVSLPPGGSAGGDLSGTYPNPTIASNAVNSAKIQDLQVASTDLANNAVITTKILDGAVTQAKIAPGVSLPPGGSAGGDLTGTYPNPTIASNAVNSTKIQDLQVASTDLANNAVITTKILDGAVIQAKIAPGVSLPPSGDAGGDLGATYPNPTVDGLQGRGVSSTAPANGQVLKWNGSAWAPSADNTGTSVWATSGNNIYNTNTANVGIGTTNPTEGKLQVVGGGGTAIEASSTGNSTIRASSSAGGGYAAGNFSASGVGTYGIWTQSSDYEALYASSYATSYPAIHADAGAGTGGYFRGGLLGLDVFGDGKDNVGEVYGIRVESSGTTGLRLGVYSTATSATAGGAAIGLWGEGNGGYISYGVYGTSTSGEIRYAGAFDGNVAINGTLYKSGGSFKIDHPLDPENKYLYHSFVESPDMKNIYDGVTTLDENGEAWVELPEWFDALNKNFRYQLTCIGGYAPVYISEKISQNRFKIAGGNQGLEVSWQVTGIRKDAFAEKNRIPVEELKRPEERGKYIHPEVFGQAENMGIYYQFTKGMKERVRDR